MGAVIGLLVAAYLFGAFVSAVERNEKKRAEDAQGAAAETPPSRDIQSKRRERMQRVEQWRRANEQRDDAERWRRAKEKQDDAEQVHSIKMDSCEERLESLKTLYQAGILDQQEYDQRVESVKKKHMR